MVKVMLHRSSMTPRLCLLALASCLGAFAQTVAGYGAVTGTVRDPYGDGLPDTTVLIYNDHTGLRRTMTTTDDGLFAAPELTPGAGYSIKISRTGYQGWEYKDFDVSIGAAVDFSIVLDLEATNQKVQNTSGFTSAVEETRNNVSTIISRRQLENLPSQTSTADHFAALAPLVTRDPNSGTLIFRGVNGTNAFYTDGVNTTDTYFYQTPNLAPQFKPDSLYEMQVISSGAPAEFGWAMGGTVNAATPSGANTIHGAVYGYLANPGWRSAPRFDPGFHPQDKDRQYGGAVGFPILPGKLYFFANVERWYANTEGINLLSNPLLAGPSGTSLASNCKATAVQCAAAIAFLTPEIGRVVTSNPSSLNGIARIDYRRSDRNAVSIDLNASHAKAPNGLDNEAVSTNGGLLGGNGNYDDETRFAKGDWAWALSSVTTNNVRAAVYRDRVTTTPNPSLYPSTGALGLDIAGSMVGANTLAPSTLTETRYTLSDSFTFAVGPHAIKLGGEFDRNRDEMSQLVNRNGLYTYPTLTNFATDFTPVGQPRNYTLFEQSVGEPSTNIRSTEIAAYAQDEWRATRKLRITLAVRWEKTKFPTPPGTNSAYYQTLTIASPSTDFGPRAGFTYLINDRTVVRGGIGFFYEPFVGQLMREMYAEADFNQATITMTPGQSGSYVYPRIASGAFTAVPTGTQDIVYGTNKFRNPYQQLGTIGIERRIDRRTALAVTYVDARGQRLWAATDVNLGAPTQLAPTYGFETYNILNAAGTSTGTFTTPVWTLQTAGTTATGKSDFNSAHVYQISNSGSSTYHAVTAQLREQMLYGLNLQASYTWSHSIDDVSGPAVIGGVVPISTTPGDFRGDQGNSNFDQRNRAVFNLSWQPPFLKGNSIPARFLVNGWRFSAIATLASSLPETPLLLLTGQQFANANFTYLTNLNGSGGWNRVPFLPVNSLKIGDEQNVDARITRTLPFTERIQGMIFIEAFNALNHQYATSVNNIAYVATSGALHPVAGYGDPNAAYGRPFGTNARYLQVGLRVTF